MSHKECSHKWCYIKKTQDHSSFKIKHEFFCMYCKKIHIKIEDPGDQKHAV